MALLLSMMDDSTGFAIYVSIDQTPNDTKPLLAQQLLQAT
jgi:hypothetical protein